MDSLVTLITIFFLAYINAYFAVWIWRAMGSPTPESVNLGMIFSKYGAWVVSKYIERDMYISALPQNKKPINFYKALGACLFCFASWIGIIFMIVEVLFLLDISFFWRIFAVILSGTITSTNAVILNDK